MSEKNNREFSDSDISSDSSDDDDIESEEVPRQTETRMVRELGEGGVLTSSRLSLGESCAQLLES